MIIAVTGAHGFIGSAVMRRGAEAGHEMIAWHRGYQPSDILRVTHADGTVRAPAQAVIHCGWGGLDDGTRDDPGVLNSSAAAALRCLRRVCDLADGSYGPPGPRRWVGVGSQAEVTRTMPYGYVKDEIRRATMNMAMGAGVSWAWGRLFSVYGPNASSGVIRYVIEAQREWRSLKLDACDQKWDFLYVDDAADALLALATRPGLSGTFDIASGERVVLRDAVYKAAGYAKLRARGGVGGLIHFGPRQGQTMPPADTRWLRLHTGWSPQVTLDEGLRRTVKGTP